MYVSVVTKYGNAIKMNLRSPAIHILQQKESKNMNKILFSLECLSTGNKASKMHSFID